MRNKKEVTYFSVIAIFYLLTRLYLTLTYFDEYFDYDEGTYLLIARLINWGYLPYKDIFAVHPPLYYYTLALILRMFGDNYIIGRLFSVFLGFASLIIAYYVGKEVRNERLGIILAGFLAMNPTLLLTNFLAVQETFIEFFALISLYYLIRYLKTEKKHYAYLSLFLAGLGSTVKFTIIPHAISIYLALLIFRNKNIYRYLLKAKQIIVNKEQIKIITITYVLMTLVVSSFLVIFPTKATKDIMVVPGFCRMDNFYQTLPSLLLISIWFIFTAISFRIKFVNVFLGIMSLIINDTKEILKYSLMILLPKIIVEGLLGLVSTTQYVNQTYLLQGARMWPVFNFFWYIGEVFNDVFSKRFDDLLFRFPIILLVLFVLIASLFKIDSSKNAIRGKLVILFLINFFVYFFISPIVPFEKFLIPMWVILYIILLDFLLGSRLSKRQAIVFILVGILFLSIADFGIVYRYSKQRIIIRKYGNHSKELRDELELYLRENYTIKGKAYSANPMNTYYLNLDTTPRYLDLYGLAVLKELNASQFFKSLKQENITHFICSTWCYIIWPNKNLNNILQSLLRTLPSNYTLLYGSSYENGDTIELYSLEKNNSTITIKPYFGTLLLIAEGKYIGKMYVDDNKMVYNFKTTVSQLNENKYKVIQYSANKNKKYEFVAEIGSNEVIFYFKNSTTILIKFLYPIAVLNQSRETKNANDMVLLVGDQKIKIYGKDLEITKISGTKIRIHGTTLILQEEW